MTAKYKIAILALAAVFAGCNEEDVIINGSVADSDVAGLTAGEPGWSVLTFSWHKVEGVNQYGYTLTNPAGEVVNNGVTTGTSVTFTGLTDNTEYSMRLDAFGAAGATSYTTVLKAQTKAITPLATPQIKAEQQRHRIVVSWDAVPQAAGYEYSYVIDGTPYTYTSTDLGFSLSGLSEGTYTFAVKALADREGLSDSQTAQATATRHRSITSTVSGIWKCSLLRTNNTWDASMEMYDDGTCIVRGFWGTEGYDLDFAVLPDESNSIEILNYSGISDDGLYIVPTGSATEARAEMYYFTGYDDSAEIFRSEFSGDASTGKLTIRGKFASSQGYGTDTFTW